MASDEQLGKELEGESQRSKLRPRFWALWPSIAAALRSGYSLRAVHRALARRQLWCGSYDTFRRYVAQCQAAPPELVAIQPTRPAAQHPPPPARESASSAHPLVHPGALDGPPTFKRPR